MGESPIWLKSSQQGSSERGSGERTLRVNPVTGPTSNGWAEARGSKDVGCVIDAETSFRPKSCIIEECGTRFRQDKRQKIDVKADAVNEAEGSSPECARASIEDTTGVEERGIYSKG